MFVFEVYLKASALEFRLDSQHPLQKSFPVFPIHEKMSGNLSQQPVRGGTFPCPQPCDCSFFVCVYFEASLLVFQVLGLSTTPAVSPGH